MLRILVFFLVGNFVYPQKKVSNPNEYDIYLTKCEPRLDQSIKIKKETSFYINTGTNISEYDFSMSNGLKEKALIPQNGITLGVGMIKETGLIKNKLDFSLELDLNGLNQSYNFYNTSIEWKSYFSSLVGGFYINLIEIKEDIFFRIFYGGGISKILYGRQYFNNEVFNLSNHVEFDGLFLRRDMKFVLDLFKIKKSKISFGINRTLMKSLDKNSNQTLDFRNNSLFMIYAL
jgi:hypothetical protein